VLEFRLKNEYRVKTIVDMLPYESSAWLVGDVETFKQPSDALVVKDSQDRPVVLFRSAWSKNFARERNPNHDFRDMG
jgi:peptide chain release factor 3